MTKMGRPPTGDAKVVMGNVRLTRGEAAALEARFGSVSKGLRSIVNASLARHPSEVSVAADDPTPIIAPPVVTVNVHRHRRGIELEPTWQGGAKVKRYACTEPGCSEVLK